jgi:uncharacterized protein (TIGR03085 family)
MGARDERAQLADVIEAAGPEHPTLCEGWDTYDLVAHLVTREGVPKAAPGLIIPKLHGLTDRAEKATRAARSFPELIATFRAGPPAWQPTRLRQVDDATNLVEFFVHGEDVRRAPDGPASSGLPPREIAPELSETLWANVRRMARIAYRRVPFPVMLERTDGAGGSTVTRKGEAKVTMSGSAADLLLYGFGRRTGVPVKLEGDPDLIATLADARLGL